MNLDESAERVRGAKRDLETAAEALIQIEHSGGTGELPGLAAVRSALESAADGLGGECQVDTPFAPLRAVITPSGHLQWCCSHPTQHCAG